MTTQRLDVRRWIDEVNRLRESDEMLSQGAWHGYTVGPYSGSTPMQGYYYLVRWATPTVAISGDDKDELVAQARLFETALAGARA